MIVTSLTPPYNPPLFKLIHMNKLEKLKKISQEIEKCKVCKINSSGKAVSGEGNPDAEHETGQLRYAKYYVRNLLRG